MHTSIGNLSRYFEQVVVPNISIRVIRRRHCSGLLHGDLREKGSCCGQRIEAGRGK
jgi:hypothetical protein